MREEDERYLETRAAVTQLRRKIDAVAYMLCWLIGVVLGFGAYLVLSRDYASTPWPVSVGLLTFALVPIVLGRVYDHESRR